MKKLLDKLRSKTTPPAEEAPAAIPAARWTQSDKSAFDAAFQDFKELIALQGNKAANYQSELTNFKETHAEYLEKNGLTALIARENRAWKDIPNGVNKATTEAMKAIEEDYSRHESPRPE